MDIHRCRFVPYPPSTINVLAFSHSHASREKKADNLRLAIGRANGDIEIWNPLNGAWLQETIIRGGKDRSIDGLIWIQDPDEEDISGKTIAGRLRLFSIGYTTTVTEWDLEKGQPLRQSSGNHGEIWCLAAQPSIAAINKQSNGVPATGSWQGQNLVTGCTDGAVVLYSTADQDLKLQRVLVRPSAKKAKVISVVFQDRNMVIAGCTDSTIRVYDIRNGSLLRSMSLGVGPAGGPREIIIWAVKCLPNGNIISGDSTGEVRIWDGKTYTLVQRIKGHKQDVLSLATSIDGSMIFSGGMDRRTVVYKQIGGSKSRWGEVSHRRFHSHDVKTMATFEGKGMSIVASGGPDASPVIIPLREFGMENQRTLPCLPQVPVVQSASRKRLVVSWWDREVHIWRINKTAPAAPETVDSESEERSSNRKLVAKVIIKGEANINSASISTDGSLLAVSTAAEIKMFRLKSHGARDGDSLRVSKLDIPSRLSDGGAKLLRFSPDGHWLGVIKRDNRVILGRVLSDGKSPVQILPILAKVERLDRKIEKRVLLGGIGAYERTITRMAFSSDSRILAVSDLGGYVDTWVLEGLEDLTRFAENELDENDAALQATSDSSDSDEDEDEEKNPTLVFGQHWIRNPSASLIPKLPSAAVVLEFRPAAAPGKASRSFNAPTPHPTRHNPHPHSHDLPRGEDRLLVATATGKILELEVLHGTLSAWSRQNPTANFPIEFKRLRDQPMGCLWDLEKSKERLWLYGSNWMWMFDLSRDIPVTLPVEEDSLPNGHLNGDLLSADQFTPNRKRKRSRRPSSSAGDLTKGTTGAGSKVPDSELSTGISRKHQKVLVEENNSTKQSILDNRPAPTGTGYEDSDEDMDEGGMGAASLRAGRDEDAAISAKDNQMEVNGDGGAATPAHWWHTYKYRPILGVVPIDGDEGLEVVLVERPTWEMDLPPRYYGDEDREKPGL